MNITIHRGTDQIGGCITEYEQDGWKLFVDYGEQLPGSKHEGEPIEVEGLTKRYTDKSALFITHYHGDHIGRISELPNELPIYIGSKALETYTKLQHRLSYIKGDTGEKAKATVNRLQRAITFQPEQTINFGPFTITAHHSDHSAFDAFSFEIESASGNRVLHTGDFRAHGENLPILSIKQVDAIVCEATNISRDMASLPECLITKRFEEEFKRNKNNFVFASSTNIQRIFNICQAAYNANKIVIMDEYQYDILKTALGETYKLNAHPFILKIHRHSSKPQFFVPHKLNKLMRWKGFVLFARSTKQYLQIMDGVSECTKYLSMWKGYTNAHEAAYNQKLSDALGYNFEYIHTSGHDDNETLKQLFNNIKHKVIIPMHTDDPELFSRIFSKYSWNVKFLIDKETLNLNDL